MTEQLRRKPVRWRGVMWRLPFYLIALPLIACVVVFAFIYVADLIGTDERLASPAQQNASEDQQSQVLVQKLPSCDDADVENTVKKIFADGKRGQFLHWNNVKYLGKGSETLMAVMSGNMHAPKDITEETCQAYGYFSTGDGLMVYSVFYPDKSTPDWLIKVYPVNLH